MMQISSSLRSLKVFLYRRDTIKPIVLEQIMSKFEDHQVPPDPVPGDPPTPDQSPTPDEDPVPDHNPVAAENAKAK
ncbi:hypothetical protein D3871_11030 [Noviherbaspirillum saxi]|uniref:Uncharacterized protein n=1 Tax=Noviherbaspirillum saxi TaxID=2320863 RepID=A0A3A3GA10_9BURK|nr:hypothetical protein D3871_11030 [Noviherbaspirillum saxi]